MDNNCKLCRSSNLEFKEEYELYNLETNENELVSGLLCLDCECFHDIEGEWFQYDVVERSYKTKFIDYEAEGNARVFG